MREKIYLDRLEELIKKYRSDLPLSIYLRQEFHKRRNMGSRDRRRTREDVYNYFRIGMNYPDLPLAERIAIGGFLCSSVGNPILDFILREYSPFLPEDLALSLDMKLDKVKSAFPEFKLDRVFPFSDLLSMEINSEKFLRSFLIQPKLWIRIRNLFRETVLQELDEKKISFQVSEISPLTLSFENSSAVHELEGYKNGYFEIQDINSQQCARHFPLEPGESWWDACAGSGGKSLLLLDREPDLKLTVTDARESVLENLRMRMKKAKLKPFLIQQIDLSQEQTMIHDSFDGILADVPCSGSGTWARSPEALSTFDVNSLSDKFIPLQRKIVQNLTPALKVHKKLIYITCSVFKEENEGNIEYFEKNLPLKCVSSRYYEGAEIGGDTLFVATLEKNGDK